MRLSFCMVSMGGGVNIANLTESCGGGGVKFDGHRNLIGNSRHFLVPPGPSLLLRHISRLSLLESCAVYEMSAVCRVTT